MVNYTAKTDLLILMDIIKNGGLMVKDTVTSLRLAALAVKMDLLILMKIQKNGG
jgi:hypothetical protein